MISRWISGAGEALRANVSALAYSIVREECGLVDIRGRESRLNRVAEFMVAQRGRMPDFLGFAMMMLTLVFAWQTWVFFGAPFNRLSHEHRWEHVLAWRNSRIGARRDLVRFWESLAVLGWYSLAEEEGD
jgi:hypothetical protein